MEAVPLRDEKSSSHAQKSVSWHLLGFHFKISDEHPSSFLCRVPLGRYPVLLRGPIGCLSYISAGRGKCGCKYSENCSQIFSSWKKNLFEPLRKEKPMPISLSAVMSVQGVFPKKIRRRFTVRFPKPLNRSRPKSAFFLNLFMI